MDLKGSVRGLGRGDRWEEEHTSGSVQNCQSSQRNGSGSVDWCVKAYSATR